MKLFFVCLFFHFADENIAVCFVVVKKLKKIKVSKSFLQAVTNNNKSIFAKYLLFHTWQYRIMYLDGWMDDL